MRSIRAQWDVGLLTQTETCRVTTTWLSRTFLLRGPSTRVDSPTACLAPAAAAARLSADLLMPDLADSAPGVSKSGQHYQRRSLRAGYTPMADDTSAPQPRFDFYEVVEVRVTQKTRGQGVAGRKGAVTGVAQPEEPGQPFTYAVHLFGSEETWSVDEADLATTGQFLTRDELESGESLRVNERGEVLDE
jgi:Immunity protein 31